MQRALIIVTAVVVLLGLGVGLYFYLTTPSASVTVAPDGSTSFPVAGQGNLSSKTGTTGMGDTSNFAPGEPVAVSTRLVQISAGPVVPSAVVTDIKPALTRATSTATSTSAASEIIVTYIERTSGNVFTYLIRAKTLTRTNNKTVPGIQSAVWLPNASLAFVRYLSGDTYSTINTYALAATSTNGFFLSQNLSDIALSATNILTIASGVNGSIGSVTRLDGSKPFQAFTTPLTSIRASFVGKNQYLVFSKPSATLAGNAFLVDATGHFSRIAGPLNGLVALASPSGKWVLVSYTQNGAMQMQLVNTATNVVVSLPVATLADKCAWTADDASIYCGVPVNPPTVAYPDDWYQGVVPFSDRIWKIDVAGRYAQLILDFSSANKGDLDAHALALDPLATTLVFINKNNGSLWSYSL